MSRLGRNHCCSAQSRSTGHPHQIHTGIQMLTTAVVLSDPEVKAIECPLIPKVICKLATLPRTRQLNVLVTHGQMPTPRQERCCLSPLLPSAQDLIFPPCWHKKGKFFSCDHTTQKRCFLREEAGGTQPQRSRLSFVAASEPLFSTQPMFTRNTEPASKGQTSPPPTAPFPNPAAIVVPGAGCLLSFADLLGLESEHTLRNQQGWCSAPGR